MIAFAIYCRVHEVDRIEQQLPATWKITDRLEDKEEGIVRLEITIEE